MDCQPDAAAEAGGQEDALVRDRENDEPWDDGFVPRERRWDEAEVPDERRGVDWR